MSERELHIGCSCGSYDHQAIMVYWAGEEPEAYLSIHLITWRQWWRRAWEAMRYVFGGSRVGWDEVLINHEMARRLTTFLDDFLADTRED